MSWTILYFDHLQNNLTDYHYKILQKNNSNHQTIRVPINNSLPVRTAWRNCDALIRQKVKQIYDHIENENILFVEWDVYCNLNMPECTFDYAFSKFTNNPESRPQWCHWKNKEHKKLPEKLQCFAKNITPFCFTGYKKFVIQEIIKPSFDYIYDLDIFCEVRTGTLLNYIGYPSQSFPKEIEQHKTTIFSARKTDYIQSLIENDQTIKGILHPIKKYIYNQ